MTNSPNPTDPRSLQGIFARGRNLYAGGAPTGNTGPMKAPQIPGMDGKSLAHSGFDHMGLREAILRMLRERGQVNG